MEQLKKEQIEIEIEFLFRKNWTTTKMRDMVHSFMVHQVVIKMGSPNYRLLSFKQKQ